MESENIKVWITKYALTIGIEVFDGVVHENEDMVAYGNVGYGDQYAHGKDWHRSYEEAVERAEEMRVQKIKSLRKSIAKLEKLSFSDNCNNQDNKINK